MKPGAPELFAIHSTQSAEDVGRGLEGVMSQVDCARHLFFTRLLLGAQGSRGSTGDSGLAGVTLLAKLAMHLSNFC